MPRLPLPTHVIPKSLLPKPKRPGEVVDDGALSPPAEAGASVVDWVDERTSLSGTTRWLLILTLIMGFTGYLLPFDQKSYWASVVGVNINSGGPLVGPFLSDFLRGGNDFGATTLSRFYSIHMLLVPGAIIALIGAHIYLVTKLGTTAPPWQKAESAEELREAEV